MPGVVATIENFPSEVAALAAEIEAIPGEIVREVEAIGHAISADVRYVVQEAKVGISLVTLVAYGGLLLYLGTVNMRK